MLITLATCKGIAKELQKTGPQPQCSMFLVRSTLQRGWESSILQVFSRLKSIYHPRPVKGSVMPSALPPAPPAAIRGLPCAQQTCHRATKSPICSCFLTCIQMLSLDVRLQPRVHGLFPYLCSQRQPQAHLPLLWCSQPLSEMAPPKRSWRTMQFTRADWPTPFHKAAQNECAT